MKMLGRVALTTALLVPLVVASAEAQNYRWDFGVNGGYAWYSAMLGSEDTGLADGSDRDDVRFKAGWRAGAQLGYWLSPKMALRANATYTDRSVVDNAFSGDDVARHFTNVNLWSGSLDLLFRFGQPNEEWMGREVLPYFALGLGGKWVNPAHDNFTCTDTEEGKSWACHPFTPGGVGNSFAMGEQKGIMGLVGLGTDIRVSPGFALRLEVNDRIYKPQVYLANPAIGAGNVVTLTNGDENVGKMIHEVGVDLGLMFLLGRERREVVTIAQPPAPPPPPVTTPTPPPPPPPPPREESVTICVIDPTAPGGIRMQTATYRFTQRDTVVGTQPFRSTIGNVMVARNADWYVRGTPLVLTIGNQKIEYITHQGARVIAANELSFLGTVNGYPVYANRDEVADVIGELNDVRRAQAGRDLGQILAERRDLRAEIEDVQYLYVPLEPYNCVFQTVQMMEPVKKGKQQQ